MTKKIFMIARPNGAGKTTTAMSFILNMELVDEFINADEIARGLAPLHPESMALVASKLMLKHFQFFVKIPYIFLRFKIQGNFDWPFFPFSDRMMRYY